MLKGRNAIKKILTFINYIKKCFTDCKKNRNFCVVFIYFRGSWSWMNDKIQISTHELEVTLRNSHEFSRRFENVNDSTLLPRKWEENTRKMLNWRWSRSTLFNSSVMIAFSDNRAHEQFKRVLKQVVIKKYFWVLNLKIIIKKWMKNY